MTGHRFHPDKADKLVDPKRREKLNPDALLSKLGFKDGERIADLGAGNGFFTLPMAKISSEPVYAVDIEPQMLAKLKERAEKEGLDHIRYIESDLESITLEDHAVDKVFIAFVLHEVGNLSKALCEVKRILKPGGKGLILEWEAVEMEEGPPLHERIHSDALT
ncbi:Methyltransferase type 11 [Caldalkalibacillus thermarum TA2.A1]|uniref:Methyltransferase domain-containing protein n=1 Tax=Caldalkalibacillus thermarum (strain TA2.A1) TaxID=986075 RepID=F5L8K7_CALTT|nr:methyltransferase domain-containing protein [Caldalkalibacillus thermarum]EGL82346.1 Methyltransferase type 11 [Caldalkalibacillus thermarum TA2.A1]QZT32909.1 methyltransferase domain-containing protein [Caldalkalibacillus thermarum TA2.A1]